MAGAETRPLRRFLRGVSPFRFEPPPGETPLSEGLQRSLRAAVMEGALSGVMVVLLGGVLLTGFALSLGADQLVIGLIAATQAGANLLQMPAYRFLERFSQRKTMAMRCALASRLMWIPILVLALLPADLLGSARIWLFLIFFAVSLALGIFSYVPWISWLVDLVPPRMRGRFFAGRTFAMGLPGVFLALAGGKFIDIWNDRSLGPGSQAFLLPFGCAVGAGLLAVAAMRRMSDLPFIRPKTELSFWQSIRDPFRDDAFRRLFTFRVAFDLSAGVGGTFFGLYMLQQARLSFTFVSILVVISTLGNYLSLPLWGRLIDRIGNTPVLRVCLLGKILFALLWLFTTPESFWLYVVIHLLGVFDGGNAIAIPTLVYKIAPADRRANYISVDGTVVGIAAAVAPLIGGVLALAFEGLRVQYAGFEWAHFHFLFMVAALLRVAALLVLRRVHEPLVSSRQVVPAV